MITLPKGFNYVVEQVGEERFYLHVDIRLNSFSHSMTKVCKTVPTEDEVIDYIEDVIGVAINVIETNKVKLIQVKEQFIGEE